MRLMKMGELAAKLGIPRRTFQGWIEREPGLGVFINDRNGGSWWVKLDKLAGRQGITLTDALMLGSRRWVAAVDLAILAGISKRTMSHWCRTRPGFAKRIGQVYYVDLEELGASFDDVEELFQQLRVGGPGNKRDEEGE